MKVLVVIPRLQDHGGAEVSTGLLLRSLQGRGVDFVVVTLHGHADLASRDELERRGVRFHLAPPGLARRVRYLREVIVDEHPDLVHATLFEADVAASLAGTWTAVPVLSSVVNATHSPSAARAAVSPWKLELVRWISAAQLRLGTSHAHAITDVVADEVRTRLRLPDTRLTVVPRGRDVQRRADPDERLAARAELGLSPRQPTVLNVARQEAQKGQTLLVEAMRRVVDVHPDAVLLIAGRDGAHTTALRRRIAELGLDDNVRLLGVRSDVSRLLAASDVFAFSSRWEGLGGAVIEAMAAGTPVVAFAIPTMSEVVGDTGRLVPPFDTDAFADAVLEILREPGPARERADRARTRVLERYSADVATSGMAQLYELVAAMPPPPASRLCPSRSKRVARVRPGDRDRRAGP